MNGGSLSGVGGVFGVPHPPKTPPLFFPPHIGAPADPASSTLRETVRADH
ncbi:hypothetical protein [Nocardia cyriacigeorgica]|nr:hypothetical protein [Nocardia cyriacigeorgica]